jgi:hypothetical protein
VESGSLCAATFRLRLLPWLPSFPSVSYPTKEFDQLGVPPDFDSLRTLARRIEEVHREPVCAVIESMTGARLVHETLEQEGWSVEIADAQKVKGLAPLPCKTDKIDSKVLAALSHRLAPRIPPCRLRRKAPE